MKKMFVMAFVIALAILVGVAPASAQRGGRYNRGGRGYSYGRGYGYDAFHAAQMEYRLRQMEREAEMAQQGQYPPQYPMGPMPTGYNDPCAAFVIQAQGDGLQPFVYGGIAAAGTRVATRDPRWVAGMGMVGAIAGVISNSRNKKAGREALAACQRYLAMQQGGGQPPQGGGPSYQQGGPSAGYSEPVPAPETRSQKTAEGGFCIVNSTKFWVELYDGERFIGRLAAGQTIDVPAPEKGYRGLALVPNHAGGLGKGTVKIQPTDSGWEFVPPKF